MCAGKTNQKHPFSERVTVLLTATPALASCVHNNFKLTGWARQCYGLTPGLSPEWLLFCIQPLYPVVCRAGAALFMRRRPGFEVWKQQCKAIIRDQSLLPVVFYRIISTEWSAVSINLTADFRTPHYKEELISMSAFPNIFQTLQLYLG